MKTIYVEEAQVEVNGTSLGTVKSVDINGSIELWGTTGSAWVNLRGDGSNLASKTIAIGAGLSASGANWDAIEADILSQLGLTKSANQTPPAPVMP